jgi:sulfur-oxidizing protein SoxY
MQRMSRREMVTLASAGATTLVILSKSPASATPAEATAEIARFTNGKTLEQGKITVELPEIAENGSTIPLLITVDSPMTADDYVSEVLVLTDGNPRPRVVTFHFTAMSGRALAATRIRLASTENVIVVAKTGDGRFFSTQKQVKVTIGGCGG